MGTLQELLNLTGLSSSNEIKKHFNDLAEQLLNNYQIVKGDKRYDILEIEFYYYCQAHPDIITYPRTVKAGYWFFHNSGVDLSFESDSEKQFGGGILIRGVKSCETNKEIKGPINSMSELFDQFDALKQPSDLPMLIALDSSKNLEIKTSQRIMPTFKNVDPTDVEKNKKCEASYERFAKEYNAYTKHDSWSDDAEFSAFVNAEYSYIVK